MKILYYSRFFQQLLAEAEGFAPSLVAERCEIFFDRSRLEEADGVVFHLPNMGNESLPEKRRGQLWVALSVEANANYPFQMQAAFMAHFDIRMMLDRHCDLPLTYLRPEHLKTLRQPPRWKLRSAPAVFFCSSHKARSHRNTLLDELGKHLKIDRYGKGDGKTRRIWCDRGLATKLRVISRYHFCLAFENCVEDDYVSEKVYDALIAGTVPVYWGAPNVARFLPSPRCIINASDYESPTDLAHFLCNLKSDRRRYDEYLSWKQEPFAPEFLDLARQQSSPSIVRLCDEVARRQETARQSLELVQRK